MINITDEEFVRLWETSERRDDVAQACGCTGPVAGMHASRLRRAGVQLKRFARGRSKGKGAQRIVDVDGLNGIITSLKA